MRKLLFLQRGTNDAFAFDRLLMAGALSLCWPFISQNKNITAPGSRNKLLNKIKTIHHTDSSVSY